jgi:hypothetical protein
MAELNPNIILGIQAPQVQPYDASQGMIKGLTLKNLIQQGKTGEMQAKIQEQLYNDDLSMREAYKVAGGNPEAVRDELVKRGLYKQVNEFDKNALEKREKTVNIDSKLSGISKDKLETDLKKLDVIRNVGNGPLIAYKNAVAKGVSPEMAMQAIQPMWESAITGLKNTGMFDEKFLSTVPQQFDPNQIEAQLAQTLKYSDVLNNEIQRRGQDITLRGQDMTDRRTREEGAANRGVTMRGQNITRQGQMDANARADETNKISREKLEVDKTKAKNEKVTDTQRANSGYAARMKAADKIFEGTKSQKPGIVETVVGGMPVVGNEVSANVARGMDGDRQQSRQAQEDWVRAKLRKESGAVIGEEEMDREIRTYFPQIGDGKEVVKQKANARKQALAGMETASGSAYTPVVNGSAGDWSIEEVK